MNTGVISLRYAKALLKLVDDTGHGEAVYDQVRQILKNPDSMPELLEPELQNFVQLLIRHKRMEHVRLIFRTFLELYNKSRNRKLARLTTAVPVPELEPRIQELLERKTGSEIVFESNVDPSLIGGFVLTVDDSLLDASISRQIWELRRQFVEKNNRLV